jgi:hypothetical protein
VPGFRNLDGAEGRFPHFERPARVCPTSTFRGFVKQVKPSNLTVPECNFLNAVLGGFLTGTQPPGNVYTALTAVWPTVTHEARLPRRYDGDRTLPHGRYYTVCEDSDGEDSGTLHRELLFYKKASTAEGHVEFYDLTLNAHRKMVGGSFATDGSAREGIILRFTPFAQPAQAASPFSFSSRISLELNELCVENALDLRRPVALDWLYQTIPGLRIVLNDGGDMVPCFPHRPKLETFGEILPSFMDQSRGGGNFDKLVGLYLRQLGISGLVFPSVRNDAYTNAVDGEVREFHGWSFVDYRDAPRPQIVAFSELRPNWPRTIVIEGGDDNEPTPAAFADECRIVMTQDFSATGGTMVFRGLAQRIEAYSMVDSMEAAVRFRLPDATDEEVSAVMEFAVSLGSRDAVNFSRMVLYSLLGLVPARNDLRSFVTDQLGQHPLSAMLARCADPPPAQKEFEESAAFLAIFKPSSTAS